VTAYVGGIRFLQPINVGELVEVRARIIRTGNTSMDVAIDIYSGDPKTRTHRRACHCVMVFVAIDTEGKPKPVPRWSPVSPVDQALEQYALRLSEVRKTLDRTSGQVKIQLPNVMERRERDLTPGGAIRARLCGMMDAAGLR
jgi:acyl-CoA hydrolase